jgi:branched-chain amino acid transport system substrate-binding protein
MFRPLSGTRGVQMRLKRYGACLLGALTVTASLITIGQSAGAAAKKAPIVIGDVCSCTGPEASSVAQTSPTLQAWAKYVTAHGGIQGHPVQLIVKDDGYNPATSLADVQTLVTADHVAAIFDNSDVDTSWTSYVAAHDVPVAGGAESDAGYESPVFFDPGATYNYFTDGLAYAAKKSGAKKYADVYCAEVAVCAQSSTELKSSLPKFGLTLSYTAAISFSAPSYAAYCLAAKQSGATAMTVGDATAIVNKVVADCATQGYNPTQISGDGTVAISWLAIPGMEGNIDIQPNLPFFVHDAATKPMYEALAKYAPGVTTGPNFGEIVLENWAAGVEVQTAGAAAHFGAHPTSAELDAGFFAMPKGTTLGGLSAPISFKKGVKHSNSCFFLMGIKNQKFVSLANSKPVCVH